MAGALQPTALARIDPQMRPQLERLLALVGPRGFHGITPLGERRRRFEEVMALAAARAPDQSRVSRADMAAGAPNGGSIPVRVYRPAGLAGSAPALLYLHGGGMIMGSVAADDGFAATLAEDAGCVVVSVEYGLAPENPGTGPVEDCYAALLWLHRHAGEVGVDRDRLALFGSSAGGGLACGTAMLARDRGGPRLALQMLIYPMLDDRNRTASSHAVLDLGIWDRAANIEAWSLVLGGDAGTGRVSPYVAPARATDLTGLPPTYIEVGDLDLFLDEDLELARRLADAGCGVEIHRYPGAYHGFDQLAPGSDTARTAAGNRITALRGALRPAGTTPET